MTKKTIADWQALAEKELKRPADSLVWETPEGIADCARRIEAATGLLVHQFPKEREYFVEMRLEA